MTFLPIVERELRVAARQRSTYRTRTRIALGAIVTAWIVHGASFLATPRQVGQYTFMALSGLCLLYGLASGQLLTVDCLSSEKREGTLGLLFLTDLKGYDVVLGKLAATSVNAFYGLLAVLPVLAVPLVMGGVSNAEFWRMALVLVNTFLFSLAVGMFASSMSRDARRALSANSLLMFLLVASLPLAALVIPLLSPASGLPREMLSPCPLYAGYLSLDAQYRVRPDHFWWSVGIVHGLTWLLVLLASWVVPRSWRDKPAVPVSKRPRWRRLWHAWNYGRASQRAAFRTRLLDVNAFYWLAGRARLKPHHVWTFLGFIGCWWIWGWWTYDQLWFDAPINITTALLLNATLKLWVANEAGQRLAEDRKSGALELLLSTPLTERDILRGQFLALRRQFLKPTLVVIAVELLLMNVSWRHSSGPKVPTLWLAGITMLVADMLALGCVGVEAALTSKRPHHATLKSISRVLVLPWAIFGLGMVLANCGWCSPHLARGQPGGGSTWGCGSASASSPI